MGLFRKMTVPQSKLKLSEIIKGYDQRMHQVMMIGRCLYQGYLPNKQLYGDYSNLKGFHDYQIYNRKNPFGTKQRRKSLQVPKMSTEYLAKLIYTEKVEVHAISDNENARDRVLDYLLEVLDDNDYWTNTSGLCEVMFNEGGAVEKPTIKNDKIEIDFVEGVQFDATEYSNSKIHSGVFTSTFTKDGYYFTKLTKYTRQGDDYIIEKELYRALTDSQEVGEKINYNEYFDDKQSFKLLNFKSIPFTYKKPRIKNNQVINSPYGLPIWWNAIDTIADIDLIFDRKNTEVRWGGRTKVIPSYALKQNMDADGILSDVYADPDDPTILGANIDPESDGNKAVDLTSPIRQESFIQLLNQGLDLYCFQLGFSPGTFTSDGKTIQTATQVMTEKMATYQTKTNQEQALQNQHKNLFKSIIELAHAFNLDDRVSVIPDDLDFEVVFDDSVIIDKEQKLANIKALADDNRVPDWYYTMRALNISKEEAMELNSEAKKNNDDMAFLGIDNVDDEE